MTDFPSLSSASVPARPLAAAIALVIRKDAILLVRRANPPDAGKWGFPGGKIEHGETMEEAAIRELEEETGVTARSLGILDVQDSFARNERGEIQFHYILIAVLCEWLDGEPVAGDDALEALWFPISTLPWSELALSENVAETAVLAAKALMEQEQNN